MKRCILLTVMTLPLLGCPFSTPVPTLFDVVGGVGSIPSGFPIPAVDSGTINVEFVNESGKFVDGRVTMRIAGRQVHFTVRRIAPEGSQMVVGPDRADTVLIEATVIDEDPPRSLPMQNLVLGRDFSSGDTVVVRIPAAPVEPDCNENGIADSTETDSDSDGFIDDCDGCPQDPNKSEPGTCGCGEPDVDSDQDGILDCDDECPGVDDTVDSDNDGTPDCLDLCPFDANKIDPGVCGCGQADVDSDENGIIDCLEPPVELSIAIVGVEQDVRVNANETVAFQVAVEGFRPDAFVRVFADRDLNPTNENEIVIQAELPVAELIDVDWLVPPVAPGAFFLFAEVVSGDESALSEAAPGRVLVNDQPQLVFDNPLPDLLVSRGIGFTIAWAGQDDDDDATIAIFLDIDEELNGNEIPLRDGVREDDVEDRDFFLDPLKLQLEPGDYFVGGQIEDPLGSTLVYTGRVCLTDRLVGRIENGQLPEGTMSLIVGADGNRELGTDVDITQDVTGDGLSDLLISDPGFSDDGTFGEVYYFDNPQGEWPSSQPVAGATTTLFAARNNDRTGQRIAMVPSINPDATPDFLIGAPSGGNKREGIAYVLNGRSVRTFDTLRLTRIDQPLGVAVLAPSVPFEFGHDVAGLRDVNRDGHDEYAIGGLAGNGTVTLLRSGAFPSLGVFVARIRGTNEGDFFGHTIVGLPDLDGDGYAELLVGAPGAGPNGAGIVYLIFGSPVLDKDAVLDVTSEQLRVRRFLGENSSDATGYALAFADFDGNESLDLLIGAPGFDDSRGRAYLIHDFGNPELPADIDLGDIEAGSVNGAVFDGLASGEQFGYAVGATSDFDGDQFVEMFIGAPHAETNRGVVRMLYGGQSFQGAVDLSVYTCNVQGFELAGDTSGPGLFGSSISTGGKLNNDTLQDVAIGAPGAENGRVYLLFGTKKPQ